MSWKTFSKKQPRTVRFLLKIGDFFEVGRSKSKLESFVTLLTSFAAGYPIGLAIGPLLDSVGIVITIVLITISILAAVKIAHQTGRQVERIFKR